MSGARRSTTEAAAATPQREHDLRYALRLEALTIAWNVVEALVAIGAGLVAGSIALVGFGLDSVIETIAASALYHRLRSELRGIPDDRVEQHERRALRIVGVTFLALAAYVLYEAGRSLWLRDTPDPSTAGIVLAILSLVVMPILALAKLRVGRKIGSRALVADSKETFVCAYLSFALLVGLGANAVFGAWWADPIAALGMLPWIVKEGLEALEGEACQDESDES